MKISVVIVTFNGTKWIEKCIQSILESTIIPEIIIVDNNSTDNTLELIKNKYFENVRLVESCKNLGFGRANNLGISLALQIDSDFIFLLNQDTVIEKTTIEKLLDASMNNSDYGIISPIHSNGDGSSLDKSFLYYIKCHSSTLISDFILNSKKSEIYEVEMINAAAWFMPKKTFEIVGGFDPIFFLYGEDDNFCQRVHYHKLKIGISVSTIIKHDSGNNYKVIFPKGSKNYYNNFLNIFKVKYANVNTEYFKKISKLKRSFLRGAVVSLLKLNFHDFVINMTKYKIVDKQSIELSVLQNRKLGMKYLF